MICFVRRNDFLTRQHMRAYASASEKRREKNDGHESHEHSRRKVRNVARAHFFSLLYLNSTLCVCVCVYIYYLIFVIKPKVCITIIRVRFHGITAITHLLITIFIDIIKLHKLLDLRRAKYAATRGGRSQQQQQQKMRDDNCLSFAPHRLNCANDFQSLFIAK